MRSFLEGKLYMDLVFGRQLKTRSLTTKRMHHEEETLNRIDSNFQDSGTRVGSLTSDFVLISWP